MTIQLIVKGKVQGVYYRASAKEAAERLDITGQVKNTHTGDVEIIASGNTTSLDEFINWCKQGPPNAIVKEVIVTNAPDQQFTSFEIVHGRH